MEAALMRRYTFVDYATQAYQTIVVILILFFHNGTVEGWGWRILLHLVAMAAVHGLIRQQVTGSVGSVLGFLRHFYPVLLYTWFFTEAGSLNRMFVTEYLDPQIIRLEQAVFGMQPALVWVGKWSCLLISEIFYASYFSYYIMIAGVGLALFLRDRAAFFHYVSVVSFVFYGCYLTYIFVPVIGPKVFYQQIPGFVFPEALRAFAPPVILFPENIRSGPFYQVMAWIYRTFEPLGAAMPSSHVAVALCTVFFSFKYLRRIRWVHLAVAILLCLSTVYCRYHYAVDVIAGVLTVAILAPVGNALYRRFAVQAPEELTNQTRHRRTKKTKEVNC
jgi:membrane-associated phospholipid phosphatase